MDNLEDINEILDQLALASDDSLATGLTTVIKGFRQNRPNTSLDETKRFISEVRDWACYGGLASGFAMTCFSIILGDGRNYPPPDEKGYLQWVAYWTKAPLVQVAESLDKVDG